MPLAVPSVANWRNPLCLNLKLELSHILRLASPFETASRGTRPVLKPPGGTAQTQISPSLRAGKKKHRPDPSGSLPFPKTIAYGRFMSNPDPNVPKINCKPTAWTRPDSILGCQTPSDVSERPKVGHQLLMRSVCLQLIAGMTQKLVIGNVVASTFRSWNHMIDGQIPGLKIVVATGAVPALSSVQNRLVDPLARILLSTPDRCVHRGVR